MFLFLMAIWKSRVHLILVSFVFKRPRQGPTDLI